MKNVVALVLSIVAYVVCMYLLMALSMFMLSIGVINRIVYANYFIGMIIEMSIIFGCYAFSIFSGVFALIKLNASRQINKIYAALIIAHMIWNVWNAYGAGAYSVILPSLGVIVFAIGIITNKNKEQEVMK